MGWGLCGCGRWEGVSKRGSRGVYIYILGPTSSTSTTTYTRKIGCCVRGDVGDVGVGRVIGVLG